MVGKAGISPKEHQDLARHSTYALTARYTHSRFYDLAAAVQTLPIPAWHAPSREVLPATGTDGRQISLGPNLGPQRAISGDFGRQTETESPVSFRQENPGKHGIYAAFQGSEFGTGKVEDRGFEPLTS